MSGTDGAAWIGIRFFRMISHTRSAYNTSAIDKVFEWASRLHAALSRILCVCAISCSLALSAAPIQKDVLSELLSSNYELKLRAAVLYESKQLWLLVVEQPKGSLYDQEVQGVLHLLQLNVNGRVIQNVNVSALLPDAKLSLNKTMGIAYAETENQEPRLTLALPGVAGIRIVTVSTDGGLTRDSVVIGKDLDTELMSISYLANDTLLVTTTQMLVIVGENGESNAELQAASNNFFLDAVMVDSQRLAVLNAVQGNVTNVLDHWHAQLSMSLLKIDDLSQVRTVSVAETPVLAITGKITRLAENRIGVLAAESDGFDGTQGRWVVHTIDDDLNLIHSKPLATVPYKSVPRQTLFRRGPTKATS